MNYTVVGFDQNGPVFEQTWPGKGIGGFAALSPELTDGQTGIEGTRSETAARRKRSVARAARSRAMPVTAKGIDYLSACAGA